MQARVAKRKAALIIEILLLLSLQHWYTYQPLFFYLFYIIDTYIPLTIDAYHHVIPYIDHKYHIYIPFSIPISKQNYLIKKVKRRSYRVPVISTPIYNISSFPRNVRSVIISGQGSAASNLTEWADEMFCEETERHFLQRLGKLRGRTNFMHFVLPMHLTPSRSCASAKDCSTVSNQLDLTNSETMDGLHDTSGGGPGCKCRLL